jgi:CHAT domain-containing protein/Tfp pilus assembly protein PilF
VALGLYDKAIMRLLEALKIAEAIEPPFQENIFINLSAAYNHKSDYASALFNARKALHMAEARGDSAAVADHCNNIGVALYERGEAPAALRYLERALNIIRISDDKRELASLLGNIGNAYKAEGEIDTALVFYNEALKIAGTLSHKPTLMEALGWVGYAHNAVSEYAKGLDYINQALALARELGDKEAEGIYLGNLGSVYMRLGNFNLAEEKLQQAKNILTTIGNQRGAIRQTVNLGEIHELRGDYLGSLEAHKQALALAQKYEVKDHAAMALQGLGGVYRKIGDPEEALKYLEQALKIHRELRFKEGELEALYAIGLALKSLGKNRRAEDSLKKALPLARAINKQQSEVNCLTALGNLQQQSKQYAAALNYYQQALALATKTGHKEQEGWLYFNLGNLHLAQAEPASARVFFEKARASGERMQAFDLMHESLGGLAKVAEKQKRYADALKYYSEAIDKIESVRERLKIESYKTSFIESKLEVYEAVITLLIRLGRFEEAYEYLQRFRSRSFLEMLGPQRSDFAKGISSELWVRYRFWESKLREIYDRLGNEYGKDKRSEKKIAALNDSLQRLQQEHEKVCEEIRLRHPRAADEQGLTHPLDLKGIQQKVLQPSQSLVEYFSGPEITAAFVIQANSFHCEVLKLKREELENGVGKIRAPFQQVKEGLIRNLADVGFDLKLAQQLYERLFQPLEKYLAANTQLLIVPDGVLHYLPFEALVTSVENKKPAPQALFARYENARFLMEKYVITYAPAASILALERDTNADDGKPAGRLLGFGNPDFGRFKDSSRVDLVLKASKGLLFAPLSDRDVREVAQIMQPASVFTGKDATEERFKQEANRFAGIYLSTHAIVNENQPMYSLIAFAQDDDDEEDGFLHTYEVFNLKLNADLVTLSACETGLGKLSRGEGLIGLTRGFIYAGAPAVLVSLWSVDESTAALMKIFYQNLKAGMGKAEALRQAKLKLIRTRENGVSFAHPFLWAPFVLVGEM